MGIVDAEINVPCTIIGRSQTGAEDRYHVKAWEEADPVDTVCYHEQIAAEEITDGRETQIATDKFVFLAGTAIDGSDDIVVGGQRYRVIGPVWEAADPFDGGIDHIECKARVVTG